MDLWMALAASWVAAVAPAGIAVAAPSALTWGGVPRPGAARLAGVRAPQPPQPAGRGVATLIACLPRLIAACGMAGGR
jgi:hypothetical protein